MFDPRPLCCSSLTTAVGGTTDTNFVDSAHPTVARISSLRYRGRVAVPQSADLREEILREFYCSHFPVHPSGTKMYHDLRR